MNTLKFFVRSVLNEEAPYEVLGGIQTSLEDTEDDVPQAAEEGTPAETLKKALDAGDAYLKANPQIIADVNSALSGSSAAGVWISSADESARIEQYMSMLALDIATQGKDSRYNYPFRTALLAIGWNNGYQWFRILGGVSAEEQATFNKAVVKAAASRTESLLPSGSPPSGEAIREMKRFERRSLIREMDPVSGAVAAHGGAELASKVLKTMIDSSGAKAVEEMTQKELMSTRRVLVDPDAVKSLYAIADSRFAVQAGDEAAAGYRAGFNYWLKNTLGERAVGLWAGVSPSAVRGVKDKFEQAVVILAEKAPTINNLDKNALFADAIDITSDAILKGVRPSPQVIYDRLIRNLGNKTRGRPLIQLREYASALASMPPGASGSDYPVASYGDVPVTELRAAADALATVAGACTDLVSAARPRTLGNTIARRTGIIGLPLLAGFVGYEILDYAWTDIKQFPESVDKNALYGALKSSKIRAAAFDAQTVIGASVDEEYTLLQEADAFLLTLFDSTDAVTVTADEMQTASSMYQRAKDKYNL